MPLTPQSEEFPEAPDDGHPPSKGPSLVPLPLDSEVVPTELSEAVRAAETTTQAHEPSFGVHNGHRSSLRPNTLGSKN